MGSETFHYPSLVVANFSNTYRWLGYIDRYWQLLMCTRIVFQITTKHDSYLFTSSTAPAHFPLFLPGLAHHLLRKSSIFHSFASLFIFEEIYNFCNPFWSIARVSWKKSTYVLMSLVSQIYPFFFFCIDGEYLPQHRLYTPRPTNGYVPEKVLLMKCHLKLLGLSSLKSLSISANIKLISSGEGGYQYEGYHFSTVIPWFIQLLQTFGSADTPNNLERIVLDISFCIDNSPLTILDWEPFATILRSEFVPSLHTVELWALYNEAMTLDFPTFKSTLYSDIHLSLLSIIGPLPPDQHCSLPYSTIRVLWSP